MAIQGLSLDQKSRITLPHEDYTKFLAGSNLLYGITHRHYLILSNEPQYGIGAVEFEVKSGGDTNNRTHKILIPGDLIRLGISVSIPDNKKLEVIWVPHRMRDKTRFLLFFGQEGRGTWETIRDTQSTTDSILERLNQKSPN